MPCLALRFASHGYAKLKPALITQSQQSLMRRGCSAQAHGALRRSGSAPCAGAGVGVSAQLCRYRQRAPHQPAPPPGLPNNLSEDLRRS